MSRLETHVRWMIRSDMPEVLAIDRASYELPWSEADFLRCLQSRSCIGLVAERGTEVLGWLIYELHRSHLVLLNMAVRPDVRRCEVGTQLVEKIVSKLSRDRRGRVELQLPEVNLDAQLFFRACGFRATRVVPGDPNESGDDRYEFVFTIPHRVAVGA